jgi:hypothetical protein
MRKLATGSHPTRELIHRSEGFPASDNRNSLAERKPYPRVRQQRINDEFLACRTGRRFSNTGSSSARPPTTGRTLRRVGYFANENYPGARAALVTGFNDYATHCGDRTSGSLGSCWRCRSRDAQLVGCGRSGELPLAVARAARRNLAACVRGGCRPVNRCHSGGSCSRPGHR